MIPRCSAQEAHKYLHVFDWPINCDLLSTLIAIKLQSASCKATWKAHDPSVTKDFPISNRNTRLKNQVFSPVEERKHSSFPNMTCNPLESLPLKKQVVSTHGWLIDEKHCMWMLNF